MQVNDGDAVRLLARRSANTELERFDTPPRSEVTFQVDAQYHREVGGAE